MNKKVKISLIILAIFIGVGLITFTSKKIIKNSYPYIEGPIGDFPPATIC